MPEQFNSEQGEPVAEKPSRTWRLLRLLGNSLRVFFARLLRVEEADKPKIYANVYQSAEFTDLNYWLEIIFSIGIATLGLITNSPAVVIGAMLVSPLMGPIISSGLALALGDFYLGFKSLLSVVLSTVVSIALAAFVTWVLPFRNPTPEILARVQPNLLDLAIAVLSGMAGAVVTCRGGRGGGVTALPGVAVAVALMPPLGVVGFGVGIGWDWAIIRGGGLLFLTNLVAIIFCSFVIFFAVRMDSPVARQQISDWLEQQESGEPFYEAIQKTPLRRMLGRVGSLPRRMLILFIFLAMVSVPLYQTLLRLRTEAQIRRTVLVETQKAIPRDAIFQENIEILPDEVRVRLVATLPGGFQAQRRLELEQAIAQRAGRPARVSLYDVATRDELANLTSQLTSRSGPVPVTLAEIHAQFRARVGPVVSQVWPAETAPLMGYQVLLDSGASGVQLQIQYLSDEDLGALGKEAVRQMVRARLGEVVGVEFERIAPAVQVAFIGNDARMTLNDRRELDRIASVLLRFPAARCTIVSPVGAGPRSNVLRESRTKAVQDYLVSTGRIAAERIQSASTDEPGAAWSVRVVPPPVQ